MFIKEKLADVPMCYSITLMNYQGREYCVSASEDRGGKIAMIDTETKEVSEITGLAGGVMAIIPIPEEDGAFLAIQKFYPIFDSRLAEIVYAKIEGPMAPVMEAKVHVFAPVPFVHRIALTGKPGARKVVVATLCKDKDFIDDWSKPGSVYLYGVADGWKGYLEDVIANNIFKNHGMFTYEKRGGSFLMISGQEGVWALDQKYQFRALCPAPVSDLCLFDVDGDGKDEIICISPFHGDRMQVLKSIPGGWSVVVDEEISFGHAIWAGMCNSAPLIISCSRGGDKATRLYRTHFKGNEAAVETFLLDAGVGASNIYVKEEKGIVVLYAANHGVGQVTRYSIDLSV